MRLLDESESSARKRGYKDLKYTLELEYNYDSSDVNLVISGAKRKTYVKSGKFKRKVSVGRGWHSHLFQHSVVQKLRKK